jgi:hypothetical protein
MKALKLVLLFVLMFLALTMLYGVSPLCPVREVFTFTTIDAPRQQVWQVLTNFGAYNQWNPFYTEIDGKCVEGARLHVRAHMEDRTVTYNTEIRTVSVQREMDWNEQLILPGLLDGDHHFVLESTDSGQTRFVQHDRYSGALAPLLMHLYEPQAEAGFRSMNDALKKRAEQESSSNAQR